MNVCLWKIDFSIGDEPKVLDLSEQVSSTAIDEASRQIPGGSYTTFRTFGAKVLPLEPHFQRLEESAAMVNRPVQLDRVLLRRTLREIVRCYPSDEKRVRITLDLEREPGNLYLAVETLKVPAPEDYLRGVDAIARRYDRVNPKAKLTATIKNADVLRGNLLDGVNEVLLLDEVGQILEGLSSNFFAVRKGVVWTENERALSGITRSIVLEEIESHAIPLRPHAVNLADIGLLEEAFITSSSRAVLPLRRIDGVTIGRGEPGTITRRLMAGYARRIQEMLEDL